MGLETEKTAQNKVFIKMLKIIKFYEIIYISMGNWRKIGVNKN